MVARARSKAKVIKIAMPPKASSPKTGPCSLSLAWIQRMTRSARYNTSGAIVSPRAFATCRLMTNSIFGFTSTEISADVAAGPGEALDQA